jgi:hypothetical protein
LWTWQCKLAFHKIRKFHDQMCNTALPSFALLCECKRRGCYYAKQTTTTWASFARNTTAILGTWNIIFVAFRRLYNRGGQKTRRREPNVTGWDVMAVIMAKTRRKCSNRKRIEKLSVTMATHSRCNIFVPSRLCHRKYRDTSRLSQTSGNYSAANINRQAYQTYLLPPSLCSRVDWYVQMFRRNLQSPSSECYLLSGSLV